MFRRRSRGSTVLQDLNVPELTSRSEAPGEPGHPLAAPKEEPDQELVPPDVVEDENAKPSNKEASAPEIYPDVPQNEPKQQETHTQAVTQIPPINSKQAKAPGNEHPTNDDGVVEDMKMKFTASKNAALWNKYVKIAEAEDKDILEDWEGAVDVTLVFAALFSAISTGFVLESSKNLKPDQGAVTVLAIRELISIVQNGSRLSTGNALSPRDQATLEGVFEPSTIDVLVNCLWFLSLGLSISVSLFAMLAKRWCYRSRSRHSGTDYERAMRRQKAWDTLQRWKLELFIEQLPTVMHIALMSFFIGLVLYLSQIHQATMIITAIPVGFTILSYGALTVLPAWSPAFPMVTPFTRIMHSGSWYIYKFGSRIWSKLQEHPLFLSIGNLKVIDSVTRVANRVIGIVKRPALAFRPSRTRENEVEISPSTSSAFSERWVMDGTLQPIGRTITYARPEEQRYPFRALLWLLRNSNDKTLINDILEYVSNFPEVVLDSFASSQELYEATIAITEHFQRLKHDSIEWHDLNATQFSAKCGRLIYLIARPWLHYSVSKSRRMQSRIMDIYVFMFSHSPDMSTEEVKTQLKAIQDKRFPDPNYVLWLEQEAVKIVLGCPPETGFKLCRALYQSITSKVPVHHEKAKEIYSTLSWMFLNTVTDASGSTTFWPTHESWDNATFDAGSMPVAGCDSTLTLCYFRHSETRNECSEWLHIVGFSGMLNVPTYYLCEDVEPDIPENHEYYASIIELLGTKLTSATVLESRDAPGEPDQYIGKLPVHWKSQIRLYEFDSLQYCYAALDRAIGYPRFAQLIAELRALKDMIPENRRPGFTHRSEPNLDVVAAVSSDAPASSRDDIV